MRAALLLVAITIPMGLVLSGSERIGHHLEEANSNAEARKLTSVFFLDKLQGWAVGDGGVILHTSDGGDKWLYENSGVPKTLTAVYFLDPNHGWAVGTSGVILKTANGGESWEEQPSGTTNDLYSIKIVSSTEGWILGNGVCRHSRDGGSSWPACEHDLEPTDARLSFVGWSQLWLSSSSRVREEYSATPWKDQPSLTSSDWWQSLRPYSRSVVVHISDDGKTWRKEAPIPTDGRWDSLVFVDNRVGWLLNWSQILRTTDGGQTWAAIVDTWSLSLDFLFPIDEKIAWGIQRGGLQTVVKTDDGGYTWQKTSLVGDLQSLFFISDREGWVVTRDGSVVHTADAGQTWHEQLKTAGGFLARVYFATPKCGWAVGAAIFRTSDGGEHWKRITSVPQAYLYGVYFLSPTKGWAFGRRGTIIYTKDGGTKWRSQESHTQADLRSAYFAPSGMSYIVGRDTILQSRDGGNHWIQQQLPNRALPLLGTTVQQGAWLTDGQHIFQSIDKGKRWAPVLWTAPPMSDLFRVSFTDTNNGWILSKEGILHTDDGGATWRWSTLGPSGVDSWWFADPKIGWAVGRDGRILKTSDGGSSWKEFVITPNTKLNSVYFATGAKGWIAGDGGLILYSDDGGQYWTVQPSNTFANLCSSYFTDEFQGWMIGDSEVILHTADGGRTWRRQHGPAWPESADNSLHPLSRGTVGLASSDGKKGQDKPDDACISSTKYSNMYFGVTIPLPDKNDLHPVSRLTDRPSEAFDPFKLESLVVLRLGTIKNQFGNLRIVDSLTLSAVPMLESRSAREDGEGAEIVIGSRKFLRLSNNYETSYQIKIRGYRLTFTIWHENDTEGLENSLRKMTFFDPDTVSDCESDSIPYSVDVPAR